MSSLRIPLALVLLALAGSSSLARGADKGSFFYDGWGPVVVTTEVTAAGKALPLPKAAEPALYQGSTLGCTFGSIPGDTMPEPKELARFVAGILAKQGYLAAGAGQGNPSLFLVVQWGYLRRVTDDLRWFLGFDPIHDNVNMRPRAVETVLSDARSALYGIVITAYEAKTVHSAKPVVYWQTRIGLPANGKSMAQALPVMIASAGPAIGRPADLPALLDTDEARAGRVTLGELQFLDYLNELPPTDSTRLYRGVLKRPSEIESTSAGSTKS